MLKEYFFNLHRVKSMEQFYSLYYFIDDHIDLMLDWWEEIINRGLKPEINVSLVVTARIWDSFSSKANLAKVLYRIGRYDSTYWEVPPMMTENEYVNWFVQNYEGTF